MKGKLGFLVIGCLLFSSFAYADTTLTAEAEDLTLETTTSGNVVLDAAGDARLPDAADMGTNDASLATKKYVDDNAGFNSGCSAEISSTQTIVTTTNTKIQLATELWDLNNEFDTSTYRFTPTESGKYLCTLYGHINAISANGYGSFWIEKNGTTVGRTIIPTPVQYNAFGSVTCIVELDGIDDYLEAICSQHTGSDKDLVEAVFSVQRVY